jgi:hypothetical protein
MVSWLITATFPCVHHLQLLVGNPKSAMHSWSDGLGLVIGAFEVQHLKLQGPQKTIVFHTFSID